MTKTILPLTITVLLFFNACSSSKTTDEKKQESLSQTMKSTESDVPFLEAKNYFVNNTYEDGGLSNPKITTQADFDMIFGMATTMGENGKPTPIDFSKQYVIALIEQKNDRDANIEIKSLKKIGNTITLAYHLAEAQKQTYIIRPFVLLIVDKQYQGSVQIQKL